jgi:hypothetical protein
MNKAYPVIRILIQLLMCGPMLALFPLAVIMGVAAICFAAVGKFDRLSEEVGYGFGWLGQLGLISTILIPAAFFKKRTWARWAATVLISCGYLATAAILLDKGAGGRPAAANLWGDVRLFGGPVFVGAWNLFRIWNRPSYPPPAVIHGPCNGPEPGGVQNTKSHQSLPLPGA